MANTALNIDLERERELALTAHARRKAFHARIAERAQLLQFPPDLVQQKRVDPAAAARRFYYEAHQVINAPDAKETLHPVRRVQLAVCRRLNVTLNEMTSERRNRPILLARQVALHLCRIHTQKSMPDLGRRFGGRDHTTVIHALRTIERIMGTPHGSSIGPQWPVKDCDLVRDAIRDLEVEIAGWRGDQP